jgi:hypothetical protein
MAMLEYSIRSPSQALPSVIEPITGAAFSKIQLIFLFSFQRERLLAMLVCWFA